MMNEAAMSGKIEELKPWYQCKLCPADPFQQMWEMWAHLNLNHGRGVKQLAAAYEKHELEYEEVMSIHEVALLKKKELTLEKQVEVKLDDGNGLGCNLDTNITQYKYKICNGLVTFSSKSSLFDNCQGFQENTLEKYEVEKGQLQQTNGKSSCKEQLDYNLQCVKVEKKNKINCHFIPQPQEFVDRNSNGNYLEATVVEKGCDKVCSNNCDKIVEDDVWIFPPEMILKEGDPLLMRKRRDEVEEMVGYDEEVELGSSHKVQLQQQGVNLNSYMQCVCPYCKSKLSTASSLQAHIRRFHSKVKPFECLCCEEAYETKQKLLQHLKRSFVCQLHIRPRENSETEPFATVPTILKARKLTATGAELESIACCEPKKRSMHVNKTSQVSSEIQEVLVPRNNVNKWNGKALSLNCSAGYNKVISGEEFAAQVKQKHESSLPSTYAEAHVEKFYKCANCCESFKFPVAAASHSRSHGPGHLCDLCEGCFTTSRNLWAHKVRVHKEEIQIRQGEILACDFCGLSFISRNGLATHRVRVHINKMHNEKKNYYHGLKIGLESQVLLTHK